jgi:hypothetical protein
VALVASKASTGGDHEPSGADEQPTKARHDLAFVSEALSGSFAEIRSMPPDDSYKNS